MIDWCFEEPVHSLEGERKEKENAVTNLRDSDDESDFEGYADIVEEEKEQVDLINLTDCLLGLRS